MLSWYLESDNPGATTEVPGCGNGAHTVVLNGRRTLSASLSIHKQGQRLNFTLELIRRRYELAGRLNYKRFLQIKNTTGGDLNGTVPIAVTPLLPQLVHDSYGSHRDDFTYEFALIRDTILSTAPTWNVCKQKIFEWLRRSLITVSIICAYILTVDTTFS